MKSKALWGVVFTLVVLNGLTIAYFLSSGQPHDDVTTVMNQDAIEQEDVATIGDVTISRQQWLTELEKQYGKEILKEMVDEAVIKNLSKKHQIKIADDEMELEIKMIKATYGNFDGENFNDENIWREQLEVNMLLEELLTKDVEIPEVNLKKFYDENKEIYDVKTSYQLAHILVNTKEDADQVVEELENGSNFATLAMEKSLDEFTASQGGELGYINARSDFVPKQYVDVAKTLTEKGWSMPITIDNGYAVIFLKAKVEGASYSFAEVKNQIRRQIALEQMGEAISVQPFWEEAKVTWFYGNKQ